MRLFIFGRRVPLERRWFGAEIRAAMMICTLNIASVFFLG
jgi:hypothetical protein